MLITIGNGVLTGIIIVFVIIAIMGATDKNKCDHDYDLCTITEFSSDNTVIKTYTCKKCNKDMVKHYRRQK